MAVAGSVPGRPTGSVHVPYSASLHASRLTPYVLCGPFPAPWIQAPGPSTIRAAANRTDRLFIGDSPKGTPNATTQPPKENIGHRTRHVIGAYGIAPRYLRRAMFCGGIFLLASPRLATYRNRRASDARAPETVTAGWTATPALAPWLNGCSSFFPPVAPWVPSRRSARSASAFPVRPFVTRRCQRPPRPIARHFHLTGNPSAPICSPGQGHIEWATGGAPLHTRRAYDYADA